MFGSTYEAVKRLLVLAYDNTTGCNQVSIDSFKKCFLPRAKIESYNIEIVGRTFYDQSINDSIKQYDEGGKVSIRQGDDYTTGCLLEFAYFKNNYGLNAADLNKQKALAADSRAIHQIVFTGKIKSTVANARVIIYHTLQKTNETILQFAKGTTKDL